MVFKNFYIQVTIRVFVILLTCLVLAWLIVSKQNWLFILHTFLLLMLEGVLLIRYTNRWNNELSTYFERLEAGDLAIGSKSLEDFPKLKEMKKSLTKLRKSISDERKRHEIDNEYFKVLSNKVATGIIVTDGENKVRFINPAALHLLGISTLRHLGHLERNHPGSFSIFGGMKTGDVGKFNIRDNSGGKHLIIRLSELYKDGEKYKVFSLEDIEKAIRNNELQSWQKLIRVLNHEIMNSISPINSTVQTLAGLWKDNKDDPGEELVSKTLKGLHIIQERGEGLKAFVGAYRNLTTTLLPKVQETDVHDLVEKAHELYKQELASKKIQFMLINETKPCFFNTDPSLLSQAVINIIKNAIEAFEQESLDPQISVKIKKLNNSLSLTVIDNGKGMDESTLKNASVPFFTTKDKGSGVGLSLSRQIITALNGEINIISQEGISTKVEILLQAIPLHTPSN